MHGTTSLKKNIARILLFLSNHLITGTHKPVNQLRYKIVYLSIYDGQLVYAALRNISGP